MHSFIDLLRSCRRSWRTLFALAPPDCRHSFPLAIASRQSRDKTVPVVSTADNCAWVLLSCPKRGALPAIPAGFHSLHAASSHARPPKFSDKPCLVPLSGSARGLCCAPD